MRVINKENLAISPISDRGNCNDAYDGIFITRDKSVACDGKMYAQVTRPEIDQMLFPVTISDNGMAYSFGDDIVGQPDGMNYVKLTNDEIKALKDNLKPSTKEGKKNPIFRNALFNNNGKLEIRNITPKQSFSTVLNSPKTEYTDEHFDKIKPKDEPDMEITFNTGYLEKLIKVAKEVQAGNGCVTKMSIYKDQGKVVLRTKNEVTKQGFYGLLMLIGKKK